MRVIKSLAALAVALLLAACSSVGPIAPDKVRVRDATQVGKCHKVGRTSVALYDQLAAFKDDPAKVRQALEQLARRSAVTLDGDTVVPAGEALQGQQDFDVYRCVTH